MQKMSKNAKLANHNFTAKFLWKMPDSRSQIRNSRTYLLGSHKSHMSQGLVLLNPTQTKEMSCNSELNFTLIALPLQIVPV